MTCAVLYKFKIKNSVVPKLINQNQLTKNNDIIEI